MLFVFTHVLVNDGGDAYGHAFQYAVNAIFYALL
jgi:hypothetical protein